MDILGVDREKIIQKALKLREHALRGVPNEKQVAERMYYAYVSKHNITAEELGLDEWEFFRQSELFKSIKQNTGIDVISFCRNIFNAFSYKQRHA